MELKLVDYTANSAIKDIMDGTIPIRDVEVDCIIRVFAPHDERNAFLDALLDAYNTQQNIIVDLAGLVEANLILKGRYDFHLGDDIKVFATLVRAENAMGEFTINGFNNPS